MVDRDAARRFLGDRFAHLEEGEQIEIRPIHASSGARAARRFCRTVEEALDFIESVPPGFEIYYGVNARRGSDGTKQGVTYVNALHTDVDGKHYGGDLDAALAAVLGLELSPTTVVNSGHGWHAYWEFVDRLPAAVYGPAVEEMMRRLYFRLGGVDAVQDISRILRVPGTTNHKDPAAPVPVTTYSHHPARRYTLADFDTVLPALPPTSPPQREIDAVVPPGEKPTIPELELLLSYIDPRLPYQDYYLIWGAVAYYYPDQAGLDLVDRWSSAAREESGQYSSPRTQPEKHAGFKRQTGKVTTLGTLVHYAKAGGYVPPQLPKNGIIKGRKQREAYERLEDLPNPTYDDLPYWLQRTYDHLGPLTEGQDRDLVTTLALGAWSILWPKIRFENLPLSLFVNVLMEQGSGKSKITNELEKVYRLACNPAMYTHGSPQGMYKAIGRADAGRMYASLDEFGDFLATLKSEHMHGTRGILNGLYDGRSVHYQLSRESLNIEDPYLVVIGTTTPRMFMDNVTPADLEGGFASRFAYVAPYWRNAGQHSAPSKEAREQFAAEIAEHAAALEMVTLARFDGRPGEVPAAYAEYERLCGVGTGERRGLYDAVNDPQSPMGRYLARVKRAAGDLELAERRPNNEGNVVIVRARNLELAVTLVRRWQVYQEMVLALLAETEDEKHLGNIERALRKAGPEGLTRTRIMQLAHVRAADLRKLLPLLEENGTTEEFYDHTRRSLWRIAGAGGGSTTIRAVK
jgi:hypothetical protein